MYRGTEVFEVKINVRKKNFYDFNGPIHTTH
ncbi:hypothetical protein SAMN05518672_1068 [Chitinophaga sp. CF118]|nr:hypothetical protein SAMN05518672_1068 [Chitinophaga sp. CF118]